MRRARSAVTCAAALALLFCALAGASAASAPLGGDPCALPGTPIAPAVRGACYVAVPYNATAAKQTLRAVAAALDIYPFVDLLHRPPHPFELQSVDVRAELSAIAGGAFASDWAFQRAVAALAMRLRDGHTAYFAPKPYTDVVSCQPLLLLPGTDGVLRVGGITDCYRGMDPVSAAAHEYLIGGEIVSVDDLPPWDWLRELSLANNPFSKVDGPNVNQMLQSLRRWQSPYAPPSADHLAVAVALGDRVVSVDVPWLTQSRPYSGIEDFKAAMRASAPAPKSRRDEPPPAAPSWAPPPLEHLEAVAHSVGHVWWAAVYRGDTAVLRSHLMAFAPDTAIGVRNLTTVLAAAANLTVDRGIRNLILDVRGNGGGLDCLSFALLAFLVREWNVPPAQLLRPHDIRVSPSNDVLVHRSEIYHDYHLYPSNERIGNSTAWYDGGPTKTRGGRAHRYSQLFVAPCEADDDPLSLYDRVRASSFGHYFKSILVLSDGICGSGCAVAADMLSLHGHAQTVATGGIPSQPMMAGSFPGGEAATWGAAEAAGLFPGIRMPNNADIGFITTEQYFDDMDVPADFLFIPADHRVPYWGNDDAVVYDAVRKIFSP